MCPKEIEYLFIIFPCHSCNNTSLSRWLSRCKLINQEDVLAINSLNNSENDDVFANKRLFSFSYAENNLSVNILTASDPTHHSQETIGSIGTH